MDIRRLTVVIETVFAEGGLPADPRPVRRVAACAVVNNAAAGTTAHDLELLVALGEILGERLATEALAHLQNPVLGYGKAAIVGLAGEVEHAAAVLHPRMGRPIRAAIGGGKAVIPSTAKVAPAGTAIDVPLAHRDDPWDFGAIDTMTVSIPDAPRPGEMVVIVALSDGGRPRARINGASAKPAT